MISVADLTVLEGQGMKHTAKLKTLISEKGHETMQGNVQIKGLSAAAFSNHCLQECLEDIGQDHFFLFRDMDANDDGIIDRKEMMGPEHLDLPSVVEIPHDKKGLNFAEFDAAMPAGAELNLLDRAIKVSGMKGNTAKAGLSDFEELKMVDARLFRVIDLNADEIIKKSDI